MVYMECFFLYNIFLDNCQKVIFSQFLLTNGKSTIIYGIQVHFKSGKSIKDELVAPKDKDHLTKKEWHYLQI